VISWSIIWLAVFQSSPRSNTEKKSDVASTVVKPSAPDEIRFCFKVKLDPEGFRLFCEVAFEDSLARFRFDWWESGENEGGGPPASLLGF
jgi:hypothetical protein